LALLFGIVQAAAGEVWWDWPGRHPQPVADYRLITEGAADEAFHAYHRAEAWRSDPILLAIGKRPDRQITRTRRQIVSDSAWYRSATFERYHRMGGRDHALVSLFQVSD